LQTADLQLAPPPSIVLRGKGLARVTVGRNFSIDEWQLYFPGEPYRKTFAELPKNN